MNLESANLDKIHRRPNDQNVPDAEREDLEQVDLFDDPVLEQAENRRALWDFGAE